MTFKHHTHTNKFINNQKDGMNTFVFNELTNFFNFSPIHNFSSYYKLEQKYVKIQMFKFYKYTVVTISFNLILFKQLTTPIKFIIFLFFALYIIHS